MNKNTNLVAALNENKYLEYKCKDTEDLCTSIIQSEDSAQIIFSTGLTITFEISKLAFNEFQTITWLSASISLIDSAENYNNNLIGLMGNYNGDPSDDVVSRTGVKPTDMNNERSVYNVAISCNFLFLKN